MSSLNNNKQPHLYDKAYDTLSWFGESAVSLVTDAVCKSAQVVVKVLAFGEEDIDPKTLESYRSRKRNNQPLPAPFSRFRLDSLPNNSCISSQTALPRQRNMKP